MDRKGKLHTPDEGMTGIYFHEERDLDLADSKKEAKEKIRDMIQKGVIKITLGEKWKNLVEQNSFVKIRENINRYAQLVNKLVKLDNDRQLVFQDEINSLSGIIERCYIDSEEIGNAIANQGRAIIAKRLGLEIELKPLSARDENDRPRLITRRNK